MKIAWLEDANCQAVACVGGKVANLSRLAAAHRVPTGMCLTTAAYAAWLDSGGGAWPDALRAELAMR